ncbi:MAG: class I adenylate-forming enzyme family protein [Myxococcota bacterium]
MHRETDRHAAHHAFGLLERLALHAARRPDAPAIRFVGEPTGEISWRELGERTSGVAAHLEALEGGSRRAILLAGNRIETQTALLGALASGVDVLPVSPDSPPAEWTGLARRCEASLLIESAAESGGADAWQGSRLDLATLEATPGRELGVAPSVAPDGGQPKGSILLHSSGTQGPTKIARRSPAALDALARNVAEGVGLGADDVVLLTLPLCHSYAIDFALLGAIWAGATVELHERFVPGRATTALVEGDVSVWPAVPLMLDAVSRNAPDGRAALSDTRVISAGSPLPPRVRERFEAAFGSRVAQLYGASEYGAVAYSPPDAPGFDPSSVGRPLGGVEFRIVKPGQQTAHAPLPAGEEGEVWVRSPSAMDGYLDAPDHPDPDGFWVTGDLGRLDAYGALFVTGRVKSLVDVGGRNVNPLEVEAVLARHPDVAEAVVFGIAYSDTATRLKAVVVPHPGREPSPTALREFARRHLAPHKVPRTVELRREVPRSAAGKILRQQLALQDAGTDS